jgi:hypothetical protein
MKKLFATLMIMGTLMSVNYIYASGSTSRKPTSVEKSTRVTFENTNIGAMLYIKDSEEHTLYSEEIKTEGSLTRGFDLSSLPVNEYYFEIDKENLITRIPFSVDEESVSLHHDLEENIVKPEIKLDGDRVVLSRDVANAQSLKVSIYYEDKGLIFSEKIDRDGKINRRYDLSSSASGSYLFNVEYDNRTYHEYVDFKALK